MDPRVERIDTLFASWSSGVSPGCALGVFEDGQIALARGYGLASLEHEVPIEPATVFRVASTSKQFTAATVLLLVRQGVVGLDDDIRRYLPEMPDYGRPIEVHHLIHHTSGLRDYVTLLHLPGMGVDDTLDEEELLQFLARQRSLNFPPGDRFLYTNSGYFLLSMVIQRATGQTLRELAQELVFDPLGMTATHFHDDRTEVVKRRASGYSPLDDGGFYRDNTATEIVGDGGGFTTVEDLFRWYRNFGDNRLGDGSPEIVRVLTTPGLLADGRPTPYGFGLFVSRYRGLELVGHSGAYAGFRSEMLWLPGPNLGVVCLANLSSVPASALARRVVDVWLEGRLSEPVILDEAEERPFVGLPERVLASRTGICHNRVTGNVWELTADNGRLQAGILGGDTHELTPLGGDRFHCLEAPLELELRFSDDDPDGPLHLTVQAEIERPVQTEELDHPDAPTPSELEACVGRYFSDELDLIYEIVLDGGRLHLETDEATAGALRPVLAELFRLDDMTFGFRRDPTGRVAVLVLSTGRVRGIELRRIDEEREPCSAKTWPQSHSGKGDESGERQIGLGTHQRSRSTRRGPDSRPVAGGSPRVEDG